MRMSKAPQEHVDKLRSWLQFTDELSKIDQTNEYKGEKFKSDWKMKKIFHA